MATKNKSKAPRVSKLEPYAAPDLRLVKTVQGNPFRPGSTLHERFAVIRPNMTIEGYMAAVEKKLGTTRYARRVLRIAARRGLIAMQ